MEQYDILIIGGGAAGISAAKAAKDALVLLVDRKNALGGVLLQCTHHGFGRNKSGVEYAADLIKDFPEEVSLALNTMVLSISKDRTALLSGKEFGLRKIRFSQLILATGCREIPAGALPIAGTRPKGVYTAGQMQEMINLHSYTPEGPVVILGSGDLGLIMAKHLWEAGIPVAAIAEQKDACGAMARNQQFLPESGIPLLCGSTVTQILGYPCLESVMLSDGRTIPCKTLLVAVGLKPDKMLVHALLQEDWLHLCGNCHKIYPMVEGVMADSKRAALSAVTALEKSLK